MYAIVCDGDVVGMIRMALRDEPDTMETVTWLGESARGQGIGVAALRLRLTEAARAGAASWPRPPRSTPRRKGSCAGAAPCCATTVLRSAPRSHSTELLRISRSGWRNRYGCEKQCGETSLTSLGRSPRRF